MLPTAAEIEINKMGTATFGQVAPFERNWIQWANKLKMRRFWTRKLLI